MRKIGLFLIFATLQATAFAAGHKTYTNPAFLYAVDYPEDWRIKEVGKAVSISSPFESKDDKFAENVQIVAEDLSHAPIEVGLIDYHRAGLKNAEKFLTDFKPLEEARTQWLGHDAIVMLYSMTLRGEKFRCKDYKFESGKTFYVLTYYAAELDFEKYLPAAERIMKSIRVSP